ncbi:MAG: hypothetical protein JWO31_2745 [Phycisphaerales bacterium]|nr:hypothetical protein [Phycisphaerales bacterium]
MSTATAPGSTVYNHAGFLVTPSHIAWGRTTYAMRNVSSVSIKRVKRDLSGFGALTMLGFALGAAAINFFPADGRSGRAALIALAAVMVVGGVAGAFWLSRRVRFALVLTTKAREVSTLVSPDQRTIEQAAAGVRRAMAARTA